MKIFPVFIFGVVLTSSNKMNSYLVIEKNYCSLMLKQIVDTFHKYPVIVHIDNNTIYPGISNGPVYIFNWDFNTLISRPTGHQFLQIIDSSTLLTHTQLHQLQTKIDKPDIVLFVKTNTEISTNVLDMFFYTKIVLVANMMNCQLNYCQYLNNQDCTITAFNLESGPKHFKSLIRKNIIKHLKVLQVGYTLMPPHIYLSTVNNKTIVAGFEIRLLETIEKKYNFKSKLISFPDPDSVQSLLSAVLAHKITWGMGALIETSERLRNLEFSRYVFIDDYRAFFSSHLERTNNGLNLFENIYYQSRSIFVGVCVFGVVYIYCKLFKVKPLFTFAQLIFLPLYEQTYPFKIVNRTSIRILFIIWWISCYVLTISYKTYLFTNILKTISSSCTLENLLENGYTFETNDADYRYIETECKRVPSSFCKQFLPRLSTFSNSCEVFERMYYNKVALVGETYTVRFLFYRLCNLNYKETTFLEKTVNTVFGEQTHFWAMERNSYFSEPFSRTFSVLDQSGIRGKWLRDEFGYNNYIQQKPEREDPKIYVADIFLALCILITGQIVAFLVLLIELATNRFRK